MDHETLTLVKAVAAGTIADDKRALSICGDALKELAADEQTANRAISAKIASIEAMLTERSN